MNEFADIIEPIPPTVAASAHAGWIVAAALLVTLVLVFVAWWRHSAARRQALQRVRRLRQEVARGGIDAREVAYRMAAELRLGLRASRLQGNTRLPVDDEQQRQAWRDLVARLDASRYPAGAQLDAAQLEQLLRDSEYWLRRAR